MNFVVYEDYLTVVYISSILFEQHGEQWKKNACSVCVCHRGAVRCLKETCDSVICEKVVQNHSVLLPWLHVTLHVCLESQWAWLTVSSQWFLMLCRGRSKCSVLGSAVRSACLPRKTACMMALSGTMVRCGILLAVTSVYVMKAKWLVTKQSVPKWNVPR